jgi:hypothetical protein
MLQLSLASHFEEANARQITHKTAGFKIRSVIQSNLKQELISGAYFDSPHGAPSRKG